MSSDRSARRVLVIEDYDPVADIEAMLATLEGYVVRVARSGDEGLALLAEFEPDLILLDLMLPGSVSGEQVLERILAEGGSAARVLVVSALVTPELASRLEIDGRVRTLAKPFQVRELSEQIRAMVELAR